MTPKMQTARRLRTPARRSVRGGSHGESGASTMLAVILAGIITLGAAATVQLVVDSTTRDAGQQMEDKVREFGR